MAVLLVSAGVATALPDIEADINVDDPRLTEGIHEVLVGSPQQPQRPARGRKIGFKFPTNKGGSTKVGFTTERTVADMGSGVQFTMDVQMMNMMQNFLGNAFGFGFGLGILQGTSSALGSVGSGAVVDTTLQLPIPGTGGVVVKLSRRTILTSGNSFFGNSASIGVATGFGGGARQAAGSGNADTSDKKNKKKK